MTEVRQKYLSVLPVSWDDFEKGHQLLSLGDTLNSEVKFVLLEHLLLRNSVRVGWISSRRRGSKLRINTHCPISDLTVNFLEF